MAAETTVNSMQGYQRRLSLKTPQHSITSMIRGSDESVTSSSLHPGGVGTAGVKQGRQAERPRHKQKHKENL